MESKKIKPGKYRHYKGKEYEVLGTGHHSETLEEHVFYRALYKSEEFGDKALWVRPAKMFLEKVEVNGKKIPRFIFVEEQEKHPKIGVGVVLRKNGKALYLKRKGSHGEGSWGFPGGHLRKNETINKCVEREVLEEVGVTVKNIAFGMITEDIFKKENKHYITVFMICDFASGTAKIMEKDKIEELAWHAWDNTPKPLFLPIINALKKGFNPFENEK